LSGGEQALVLSRGTVILEAWEQVRHAMDLINDNDYLAQQRALGMCQRALDLDPEYATAWSVKGLTYFQIADERIRHHPDKSMVAELQSAEECGNKALELDPACADAYSLLSICHLSNGEHDQALAMSKKSIDLAPGHAENLAISAIVHNKSGQPARGLELMKKAMRYCPFYPQWFLWGLGLAYRYTNQTDAAVSAFELATSRGRGYISTHISLASIYGELNRLEVAKKPVSAILHHPPVAIWHRPRVTENRLQVLESGAFPDE
jgi:tetratricopeptide (TPR) repeat protein